MSFAAVADVAAAVRRAITDSIAGARCSRSPDQRWPSTIWPPASVPAQPRRDTFHTPLRILAAAGSTILARREVAAPIMDTHPFAHSSGGSPDHSAPATA